ncbi:MAG: S53 family peptidase [Candidatus Acidiferrales bacterium]
MAKKEQRVELPGSERRLLPGARKIGPADPAEQIEVTVFLRRGTSPKQFPSAEKTGKLLPVQRRHLSRAQFASRHGARAGDIKKIRAFAAQNDLKVVEASRARRSVLLGGAVAAFSRAFEVELNRYEHPTGACRMRSGTIHIPAGLRGIIEGVFGLDNRPQAKPHFRVRKEPVQSSGARAADSNVSYNATQVAQVYDFPSGTNGSGQTIGILELAGGYRTADLNSYFKNLGIAVPKVTAVSVDGGKNSPTGDASGPDGEVELDIEVSGAIAPAAQIAVYFTPNTDQGFLDALTTAVHDTTRKPTIVSISWGGPETSWTQQALNAFNSACEDASTIGVTILVASGDDGASDGAASGTLTVDFPASSPFVLACGGTKLTIAGSKITSEQAWNELSAGEGATGGGVSEFFALPGYQQGASVPKAPNGFVGRGVPDVAGDADPETGYNVLVDGEQTVIGGTSAVAPLWAGLLARINQSLRKSVGYLNPLLYTKSVEGTLHDITAGSNGGYSAGPGWDACTGLGTPDGAALLTALGSAPAKRKRPERKRAATRAKRRKK